MGDHCCCWLLPILTATLLLLGPGTSAAPAAAAAGLYGPQQQLDYPVYDYTNLQDEQQQEKLLDPCGSYANPWVQQDIVFGNAVGQQQQQQPSFGQWRPQSPCDVFYYGGGIFYPSYQGGGDPLPAAPEGGENTFHWPGSQQQQQQQHEEYPYEAGSWFPRPFSPWPDCCQLDALCQPECEQEEPPQWPIYPPIDPPISETGCPISIPGWAIITANDGSTTRVYLTAVSDDLSWFQAEAKAIETGGFLAEVQSKEEAERLGDLLDRCYPSGTGVWLGANDLVENNHWMWSSDGRPVNPDFSPWKEEDATNGNCLLLKVPGARKWNRENCSDGTNKTFVALKENENGGLPVRPPVKPSPSRPPPTRPSSTPSFPPNAGATTAPSGPDGAATSSVRDRTTSLTAAETGTTRPPSTPGQPQPPPTTAAGAGTPPPPV